MSFESCGRGSVMEAGIGRFTSYGVRKYLPLSGSDEDVTLYLTSTVQLLHVDIVIGTILAIPDNVVF